MLRTNDMISYICRVCGFDNSVLFDEDCPPWKENSGSFEYCGCCGVQFGYQDVNVESIRKYRLKWFENILKWNIPESKPDDWNPVKQISNISEEFI